MENWTTYTIGEIGKVVTGKTPASTTPEHFGEAMPFVTPTDFKNYVKSISDADRSISQAGVNANTTRIIPENSVLVTCIGSDMGKVAVNNVPCLTNQQINSIILDKKLADKDFVYYALTSKYELLRSLARGGSTMPIINKTQFERIEVSLPPIEEQKAIAKILSSLDDKIELNRRMNATLEAMARALFKAWFVDFEPVHANLENRPSTSASPEIAKLFHSEFENGVPNGWTIQKVGDSLQRLSVGKKFEQKTVNAEGSVPVLDQGKSGVIGYHDDEPGVRASIEKPVIVFANHTCYMRLINFPFSAIQNVLPFVGLEISTIWLYYATQGIQPFVEYKGHFPDFASKEITVPAPHIADKFSEIIKPFISRQYCNDKESKTLSALRDSLLPRLISGKIRVNSRLEETE